MAAADGEPLAFVSIARWPGRQGVVSDLDGNFRIEAAANDTLVFSYVGYATYALPLRLVSDMPLTVRLTPTTLELQEVVVRPGENPAWRIIRAALAGRERHDPQRRAGYRFRAYHKSVLAVDSLQQPPGTALQGRDSVRWDALLNRMDWWVKESATVNYYRRPNRRKELIVASRSSLPNDPSLGFTPIDFQPFGFYQEVLPLDFADRHYLNPLSEGTFSRYEFSLRDTLLRAGGDTTFVIAFQPLPGKQFDGLRGLLYIHTDGYALENVIAEPADAAQLLGFRIQQQYRRQAGEWFPAALQTDLQIGIGIRDFYARYAVRNRTHIYDLELRPPLPDVFDHLVREERSDATQVTDAAWDSLRREALSPREANAYLLWDSLPELRGTYRFLQLYSGLLNVLVTGRLAVGPLDIVLADLLRLNRYEGARAGLGLRTNANWSDWLQLYGYGGYGFRDRAFKYGGHTELLLWQRRDLRLRLSYANDLAEPGAPSWLSETLPLLARVSVRNGLRTRFDQLRRQRAEVFWRPWPALQLNPYWQRETRRLTYDYAFGEAATLISALRHREGGLNLRWAPREQMQQVGTVAAVLGRSYPVIDLQMARGYLPDQNRPYYRWTMQWDQELISKSLGTTTFRLAVGAIDRAVPYPYLFNAPGARADEREGLGNLFAGIAFQTMGLYEFTSDRFAYLFFAHDFGNLLWRPRTPYVRPELRLLHHTAFGQLHQPELHRLLPVAAPRRGFYESGAQLNNLLRLPYFRALYIGLGAGAFYRWGPYRLPASRDNWRWQLTITLSA